MPKIRLQELNSYQYFVVIPVRITDINYAGHLGNDSMISIIHEARFRFVQHIGFKDEIDFQDYKGLLGKEKYVVIKIEKSFTP